MNPRENGMTEVDARRALMKLPAPDRVRLLQMAERLTLVGLSEGKSLAILAAIGAMMKADPGHPLWEEIRG